MSKRRTRGRQQLAGQVRRRARDDDEARDVRRIVALAWPEATAGSADHAAAIKRVQAWPKSVRKRKLRALEQGRTQAPSSQEDKP